MITICSGENKLEIELNVSCAENIKIITTQDLIVTMDQQTSSKLL